MGMDVVMAGAPTESTSQQLDSLQEGLLLAFRSLPRAAGPSPLCPTPLALDAGQESGDSRVPAVRRPGQRGRGGFVGLQARSGLLVLRHQPPAAFLLGTSAEFSGLVLGLRAQVGDLVRDKLDVRDQECLESPSDSAVVSDVFSVGDSTGKPYPPRRSCATRALRRELLAGWRRSRATPSRINAAPKSRFDPRGSPRKVTPRATDTAGTR